MESAKQVLTALLRRFRGEVLVVETSTTSSDQCEICKKKLLLDHSHIYEEGGKIFSTNFKYQDSDSILASINIYGDEEESAHVSVKNQQQSRISDFSQMPMNIRVDKKQSTPVSIKNQQHDRISSVSDASIDVCDVKEESTLVTLPNHQQNRILAASDAPIDVKEESTLATFPNPQQNRILAASEALIDVKEDSSFVTFLNQQQNRILAASEAIIDVEEEPTLVTSENPQQDRMFEIFEDPISAKTSIQTNGRDVSDLFETLSSQEIFEKMFRRIETEARRIEQFLSSDASCDQLNQEPDQNSDTLTCESYQDEENDSALEEISTEVSSEKISLGQELVVRIVYIHAKEMDIFVTPEEKRVYLENKIRNALPDLTAPVEISDIEIGNCYFVRSEGGRRVEILEKGTNNSLFVLYLDSGEQEKLFFDEIEFFELPQSIHPTKLRPAVFKCRIDQTFDSNQNQALKKAVFLARWTSQPQKIILSTYSMENDYYSIVPNVLSNPAA